MFANVGPITGRAGTERRSNDRNYAAGPVRCIGWLCGTAEPPERLACARPNPIEVVVE